MLPNLAKWTSDKGEGILKPTSRYKVGPPQTVSLKRDSVCGGYVPPEMAQTPPPYTNFCVKPNWGIVQNIFLFWGGG